VAPHARDAGAGAAGRRHALHRAADQARLGPAEARRCVGKAEALIIDESDGELAAFPPR
jgi:hypothetical protein